MENLVDLHCRIEKVRSDNKPGVLYMQYRHVQLNALFGDDELTSASSSFHLVFIISLRARIKEPTANYTCLVPAHQVSSANGKLYDIGPIHAAGPKAPGHDMCSLPHAEAKSG